MIRRLLIANRGEIALRIVRACREMAIQTVTVYSEADEQWPHALAGDRSVAIGPAASSESYLSIPKLIEAAVQTGADAVHPGYGFLAENEKFAQACADAGLVFVGPPAGVLARMGSKIESRALIQSVGVPVVPGVIPANQSDAGIAGAAQTLGLPVMIKASAGGGGKGMRTVRTAAELKDEIPAARREAWTAFADGTLYVERLLERPRHVEIQIFADDFGNTVQLFERECSIQRRHQKVIEESPSVALNADLRARMGAAAIAAARAAGYRNAGTIEFLLDGDGGDARFYFLEMNTRLQVEHPVTEAVTGVDLVRAQLIVASGLPVPWSQETLHQRGHAIECRIYAEDPDAGFLPQSGRILRYHEPALPGVRIDSGVANGTEVSVYYDPLLAKLIACAETRDLAIARAATALRDYPVLGIRTNIPYLLRILGDERFRDGDFDTSFLDSEGERLLRRPQQIPPAALAAAAVYHMADGDGGGFVVPAGRSAPDPWAELKGWRG